jgi:cytochrome P450
MIKGDGRDIMSVLLRANDSEDPQTRLSDSEVVDQIG